MDATTVLTRPRIFAFVVTLGVGTLLLSERYYGTLYHGWDAQFYYALAHSVVFDRDVDVTNNLRLTPVAGPFDPNGDGSFSAAPRRSDGRITTKYPIGFSLVEAPWLALAHAVGRASEPVLRHSTSHNGYSRLELWSVALGLFVAFAWALTQLFEALSRLYGPGPAAIGSLACWPGTSLFYYSAVFPFMAHAASFAFLMVLLYWARSLTTDIRANRSLAGLGAAIAALLLVRPQQAAVAIFLVPFVLTTIRRQPPSAWLPGLATATVLCLAAVGTTVAMNHAQFGAWSFSGYAMESEGFDWTHPKLSLVLLSRSRGLMFFSPIVIVAGLGCVLARERIPAYVWPFAANAVLQVYLVAAWSSPDQGHAFGARMWSDNAAVVAFGIAALLRQSGPWTRVVVATSAAASVAWTMSLLIRLHP